MKLGVDPYDPESFKDILARQEWLEGTKHNYVNFYDAFAKFLKIKWEKPRYAAKQKLPFIPLESEIDCLIHGLGKKLV